MSRGATGLLFGVLSMVVLGLPTEAATAQGETPPTPAGNQDCGTSSSHTSPGTTATGTSNSSSSAQFFANGAMERKLGAGSGVACKICPGEGLQCSRSVEYGDGSTISFTFTTNANGTVTATATFSGAYTVKCSPC